MELKEKLVSSFLAFESKDSLDLDSNVHEIRSKAIQNFEREGFPTKKNEEWKYTSLKSILKKDLSLFPSTDKSIGFKDIKTALGGPNKLLSGAALSAREKAWDEFRSSDGGVSVVGSGMRVLLGAW